MLGASLVLPHRRSAGADLLSTIEAEKVTLAIGVPTVWSGVMQAAKQQPANWKIRSLRRVVCGGGAPNLEMIDLFDRHYGAELIHSWGMTEINPVGTMSPAATTREEAALDPDQRLRHQQVAGRPLPGLKLEIEDEDGQQTPHDAVSNDQIRRDDGIAFAADGYRVVGGSSQSQQNCIGTQAWV